MRRVIALVLILVCLDTMAIANERAVATKEVTHYIEHWAKHLHPRHKRRALRFVRPVVRWSLHYGVDPLLVATTITTESAWYPRARGLKGEVGLMQLYSAESKSGFKIWIPAQNIRAGTKWLRRGLDTCGSVRGAIAFYNPGKCGRVWPGLKKRLRLYREAVRLVRK